MKLKAEGFSFVEVIVAVTVTGIVMMSLLSLAGALLRSFVYGRSIWSCTVTTRSALVHAAEKRLMKHTTQDKQETAEKSSPKGVEVTSKKPSPTSPLKQYPFLIIDKAQVSRLPPCSCIFVRYEPKEKSS